MTTDTATPKKGIFYGWWMVVALCFMFMVGGIMSYASTIYFPAMMKEMGWKAADLALVFSLVMWLPIIASPLAGWLTDKIGCKTSLLIGCAIYLVAGILISTINSITELIIYYSILVGLGNAVVMGVGVQTLVRKWFMKRAGLVVSLLMVSSAIFQAIMFPTLVGLSMAQGFRPIILWTTIITQGIALVLVFLVVKETPEQMGLNMDGVSTEEKNKMMAAMGGALAKEKANTLGEAMKMPQFWLWLVTYGCCAGVLMGLMGNVTTLGISYGFEAKSVGIIMTYFMVVSIIGRLGAGWLGDKFGKRNVLVGSTLVTGAILLAGYFMVNSPTTVIIMYAALGIFIMAPIVLMFPWLGDLFGRINMGKIMGIAMGIGTVIVGSFPMLAGYIKTATGSFQLFLLVAAIATFLATILLFFTKPTETQKNNMGMK